MTLRAIDEESSPARTVSSKRNLFSTSASFSGRSKIRESELVQRLKRNITLHKEPEQGRFDYLVLRECHSLRTIWTGVVFFLLVYTGTLMPFRICFLEMHIPNELPENKTWYLVELPIDVLFWVDLILSGFTSYRDIEGREICHLSAIWLHYLACDFWVNLVACLPPDVYAVLLSSSANDGTDTGTITRMVRLLRLERLVVFMRILKRGATMARMMRWVMKHQCVKFAFFSAKWRTFKLLALIIWITHLFACAWYLLASLHEDYELTWVARRDILDETPTVQWITAMYFIWTVFTTVGFGDIAGVTLGEMLFCFFTMITGTMLHSIIIGEMIDQFKLANEDDTYRAQLAQNIDTLITMCEIQHSEIAADLMYWAQTTKKTALSERSKSNELKNVIIGGVLPRSLMDRLPRAAYGGHIVKNRFINCIVRITDRIPARLSVFTTVSGVRSTYDIGSVVYSTNEHASGMYMVLFGTFSEYLSRPEDILQVGRRTTVTSGARQKSVPIFRSWSHGNYFGECEILFPGLRQSCIRCEIPGVVLMLSKDMLLAITREFTEFADIWTRIAKRRLDRIKQVSEIELEDIDCKQFAASRIQRGVRNYFAKKETPCSVSDMAVEESLKMARAHARARKVCENTQTRLDRIEEHLQLINKQNSDRHQLLEAKLSTITEHLTASNSKTKI